MRLKIEYRATSADAWALDHVEADVPAYMRRMGSIASPIVAALCCYGAIGDSVMVVHPFDNDYRYTIIADPVMRNVIRRTERHDSGPITSSDVDAHIDYAFPLEDVELRHWPMQYFDRRNAVKVGNYVEFRTSASVVRYELVEVEVTP